jgi:putative acetyltransferase
VSVVIRPEEERDHARVFEIQAAAFGQRAEADLVERLRADANPQLSLVAEDEGEVRGHIFFSPVTLDGARDASAAPPLAGLAPVGVDPLHHRKGIGSALIRAGLEACASRDWQAVFLVGDPGYYARFGFELAGPHGFSYGNPMFDAVLQLIELRPRALDGHSGRTVFHPAFEETGTG